jgi:hypothetical protein
LASNRRHRVLTPGSAGEREDPSARTGIMLVTRVPVHAPGGAPVA